MQITRAADYGVRVMVHLASLPDGGRASVPELAAETDAPAAFVSKVLQRLVKAGLAVSRRGKHGGFELAPGGRALSLLDILEALDDVPALNACLVEEGCHRSPECPAHFVWLEAQERMREVLSGASLEQLATITRAQRRRREPDPPSGTA
jgi:Rrf2 family protein